MYSIISQGLREHGKVRTVFRGRSMLPTLREGMQVLVASAGPGEVRLSDIIMYKSPKGMVVHRVIRIIREDRRLTFVTKGDNHAYIDSSNIPADDLIGIVRGAFNETAPEENILTNNVLVNVLYVTIGNLVLFTRQKRRYVPRPVRALFGWLVGGFFFGCKKFTHIIYSGIHHVRLSIGRRRIPG